MATWLLMMISQRGIGMDQQHICTCESLSWVGFIEDPCKPKEDWFEDFFFKEEVTTPFDPNVGSGEMLPQTGLFNCTMLFLIIGTMCIIKGYNMLTEGKQWNQNQTNILINMIGLNRNMKGY